MDWRNVLGALLLTLAGLFSLSVAVRTVQLIEYHLSHDDIRWNSIFAVATIAPAVIAMGWGGLYLVRRSRGGMVSAVGVIGLLFVWIGSLEWCYEVWNNMWPSGIPIIFPLIGAPLVLLAAVRGNTAAPVWLGLSAVIPPLLVWASRGFVI